MTVFGYSAGGDLVKQINADTTVLAWTYHATHHMPLTAVDELNRTTTFTYDTAGNLLTRQDSGGNTWTYTVNARGQVASEQTPDPDGAGPLSAATTSFAYDTTASRLVTITNPGSSTQTFTYTTADQVATITDELSHVTTLAYDNLDRLTGKTLPDPDGAGSLTSPVWTYKYDAIGRLTEEIDPLGNDTDYEYNARNWLTKVTRADPDGAGSLGRPEATYTYDSAGNMTGNRQYQMSGPAEGLGYTYNDAGWVITITGPVPDYEENLGYDRLGRLTVHTTHPPAAPDGQTIQYQYDSRGRVTKVIDADPDGPTNPGTSPETLYAYNNAGQISSVTDPLGRVTSYSYTAAGWLNSVTLPDPDGSGPNPSPIYTFGYDALGRQTSVSDPLNRITVTAYDSRNRQTSVTGADPDGAGGQSAPVTAWAYDNANRLTNITDPLSRVTAYGYDNLDRVLTVTLPDPDGAGSLSSPVHTYAYNALGNVTTYTDPAGKATTTTYDNLQRQLTVTQPDPDGGGSLTSPVWTYAYGANTLLASVTDPEGSTTTLGYDNFGRKTTSTTDLGYVTTFGYDALSRLTSVTTPDPDGAGSVTASVTSYGYDIYDRLTSITDALSGGTAFTYDKAGQLLTLRDPENNTTTWAYDNLGRVTMETNPLNDTRSFYHDAVGNLTRKVDRNERVTQYVYDDRDRMTAEKWLTGSSVPSIAMATTTQGGALDEVQRVGYTVGGMLMGGTFTLTFGGQTTTAISYNASASAVQSALEALSNIGVGDVSVTKLQTPVNAHEWRIDFTGALAGADQSQVTIDTSGISAFGGVTDIQATDQNGQPATTDEVQTVTLSNATGGTFRLAFGGQTTAPIAYNASASSVESAAESLQSVDDVSVTGNAGGPWTITFAGTHADTNVPQIQGDAATAESGTVARTLSFEYDLANQLTEASDPAATYNYTLDNLGRVTSETQDLANFTPNIVLASTWDANNNRLSLAATLGSNADFKNDYTYDYLNRMTQVIQQGQGGGNTVADKRVDFAYNGLGQFTTIDRYQNTGGTNIVAQTTFAYDDDNRLTDLDHKQGGTTFATYDYGYDNMGRITSIVSSVEGTSTFTYDKTSQLTGADHATPRADETYAYDDNGNRTMTGYTVTGNNLTTSDGTYDYEYDDEGNRTKRTEISSGDYEVYEWDHRNRLISVTFYDSTDTELKSVDHTYDIFNRWLRRTTDPDGPGGASAIDTFFAYDGIEPILQFDGSADTDLTNRYLFGPAVDQILASEDVTSLTSAGNILWALSDHLGTPRDIADQNEGTYTTTVTNHRTYDSFGQRTAETNAAVDLIFGETGKAFDEDTGLGNHLGRWLDPALGQWLSQDPSTFGGYDTNLRRYVFNTPSKFIDPNGLQAQLPQGTWPWDQTGQSYEDWYWQYYMSYAQLPVQPSWHQYMSRWVSVRAQGVGVGLYHGGAMVVNAFTLGAIEPLNDHVNDLIETNGGMYGAANVAANGAAASALLAGGLALAAPAAGAGAGAPLLGTPALTGTQILGRGIVAGTLVGYVNLGFDHMNGNAQSLAHYHQMAGMAFTFSLFFDVPMLTQDIYAQWGIMPVSRWGRPGLRNGDWVVPGRVSLPNYLLSCKWQPGMGNQFASPFAGETHLIYSRWLRFPSGWEWWKGFLGQRVVDVNHIPIYSIRTVQGPVGGSATAGVYDYVGSQTVEVN